MRLKSAARRWTSLEAPGETSVRWPGEARSTSLIVFTSWPIGSSRRRSSIELSRITASTASPSSSIPCELMASWKRARATTAATKAVIATRTVLTARTCVSRVRERIAPYIGSGGSIRNPSATPGPARRGYTS